MLWASTVLPSRGMKGHSAHTRAFCTGASFPLPPCQPAVKPQAGNSPPPKVRSALLPSMGLPLPQRSGLLECKVEEGEMVPGWIRQVTEEATVVLGQF